MEKIKVLIVDTDLLVHHAFAQVLGEDQFEIAGIRGDTGKAQTIVKDYIPDVLLLSIESVGKRDFKLFRLLRHQFPRLPIIILSRKNEMGAEVAISALEKGAVDFITKPEKHTGILFSGKHFEKRLASIVKAAVQIKDPEEKLKWSSQRNSESRLSFKHMTEKDVATAASTKLVVIGSCLGGPHALFSLIPRLPSDLDVPVVITQHFPKIYTRILANYLHAKSKVAVREAYDNANLASGQVWIAPGGYHTEIMYAGDSALLKVHHGSRVNDVRPNIDLLFESAARNFGNRVLGFILSGCGTDGISGARKIKEAGGRLFVQNPRTALAAEMPLAILKEGIADGYLDIDQIASEIVIQSRGIVEENISSTKQLS